MTPSSAATALAVLDACESNKTSCVRPSGQDFGEGSSKIAKTCGLHRFQHAGRSPSRRLEWSWTKVSSCRSWLISPICNREEDTMTGAGRASMVGPSSRSASQRRRVPYAVSYPAEGRFWVELGRRPFLGGRTRASIRSESPKRNLFSLIQIGRDDAASGAGACRDLARAGFISSGVTTEKRTCAADLGMGSASTVVPEALPPPGLHRRSCSVTPVQALTRHHSSASFPTHL